MPVTFVKIALINIDGTTAYEGLTDIDGKYIFLLPASLEGKLRISIFPIGYESYLSSTIKLDKENITDTIFLSKRVITLNEVKVVQQRMIKDGEKLTYRPKLDEFSASTASVELFSKLPGVSLTRGKLKLNGNEGVLILIDGRGETSDQARQLEMLTALSADKIEKIEITSAAPSKYDANITSVINVVTKKDKGNSTFRANFSQPLYMDNNSFGNQFISGGMSTNLNFTLGKIRTSVLFNLSNIQRFENAEYRSTIYSNMSYGSDTKLRNSRFALSPVLTMDYDINPRSSISFNADVSLVPSLKRVTEENYNFLNYQSGSLDSVLSVDNYYFNKRSAIQLSSNYKHILSKAEGANLYLNLIYAFNPYIVSNQLINHSIAGRSSVFVNKFNSNTNIFNLSLIVLDLIKSKKISTEFGLKSNTLDNQTNQIFKTQQNLFNYSEQLSSAFFSLRFKLSKYLILFGARGELLNARSLFEGNTAREVIQNYFKLYPNLLVQKNFGYLTASIGYTKKIRRPFLNDLNPSGRINSFTVNYEGNINYQPVFSDRVEAQLRYRETGLTINYDQSSTQPVFLPTADPFIYRLTNLNKLHKFTISVDKGFKLASFMDANVVANYSYSKHGTSDLLYHRNGFNVFEISGSGDFKLSKKTKLQAEFFYTAKMYTEYTIYRALFSSQLTLRQLLVKDKWSINLSISDPLGLEKNMSESFFVNQYVAGKSVSNQRVFAIQLVYNFPFGQKFKNQDYKKKNEGEIRDQQ